MAKYDDSFKLKVVKSYLNGKGGYSFIAKIFGVPDESIVRRWVNSYNQFGIAGIQRKKKNRKYTLQFKLDVIEFYLNSGNSVRETANKYGLTDKTLVDNWLRIYRKSGINGLSNQRGRPQMPNKPKKQKDIKQLSREQELERENELLRAELAFIKKLRASGINIPERLKK